jgi:hypothetical protein
MAKIIIFIAFAMEDENIRNMIKGQSLNTNSSFEFIDMSVKEVYKDEWQKKVRTRILRSDGVLVIAGNNSLKSNVQKREIQCAKEEGKKVRGIWAYKGDRTDIALAIYH